LDISGSLLVDIIYVYGLNGWLIYG